MKSLYECIVKNRRMIAPIGIALSMITSISGQAAISPSHFWLTDQTVNPNLSAQEVGLNLQVHDISRHKNQLKKLQTLHKALRPKLLDEHAATIVARRFYGNQTPTPEQEQTMLHKKFNYGVNHRGAGEASEYAPLGKATLVHLYKLDILPYLDWTTLFAESIPSIDPPYADGRMNVLLIPELSDNVKKRLYTYAVGGNAYPDLKEDYRNIIFDHFDTNKQLFIEHTNQMLLEGKIDLPTIEKLMGIGPSVPVFANFRWIMQPDGVQIEIPNLLTAYKKYLENLRDRQLEGVLTEYEVQSNYWKSILAHVPFLGDVIDGFWDIFDGHAQQGAFELLHGGLQLIELATGVPIAEVELAVEGSVRLGLGEAQEGANLLVQSGLGALDIQTGKPFSLAVNGVFAGADKLSAKSEQENENANLELLDAVFGATFYHSVHLRSKMHGLANRVHEGQLSGESFYNLSKESAKSVSDHYTPVHEINPSIPPLDAELFEKDILPIVAKESTIKHIDVRFVQGEFANGIISKGVKVIHNGMTYYLPVEEATPSGVIPKLSSKVLWYAPFYHLYAANPEGTEFGIERNRLRGGGNTQPFARRRHQEATNILNSFIEKAKATSNPIYSLMDTISVTNVSYTNTHGMLQYQYDNELARKNRERRIRIARQYNLNLTDIPHHPDAIRQLATETEESGFGQCGEISAVAASHVSTLASEFGFNTYLAKNSVENHTLVLLSKSEYKSNDAINWNQEYRQDSLIVDLWFATMLRRDGRTPAQMEAGAKELITLASQNTDIKKWPGNTTVQIKWNKP
ncbi:hypothetical protein HC752_01660 [Vibrio sp. S9_S30]|uniref:hypothetical protein n=1 Tax=Vibrio sp. S9_S30 TaxID=2720226 RepID=UPI0016800AFC|nr:hypothetical protein [Vibrio sp. S9_S30]MBD1555640.1 hypothetical protein [Vibrio sp. S9_S30]